jgi:hypothetical protein
MALVVQALLAGGAKPAGGDPFLPCLPCRDRAARVQRRHAGDNALATIQAIPAMAGVDLTDLAFLANRRSAPDAGAQAVLLLAFLLVTVLCSAIIGRTERSRGKVSRREAPPQAQPERGWFDGQRRLRCA